MEYKLVCFDMDGVFFKDVNFWLELHKAFGTYEKGKQLTDQYLYTDYDKLVEEVVEKLWKGKDAQPYYDLVHSLEYLPGVAQAIKEVKKRGYITAIISASSIDVARRVQHDHGIDHVFANELVIRDNKVSGEFLWPIGAGDKHKARISQHLCTSLNITPKQAIYIGDSDRDKEAFKIAGKAIAFNSTSEKLKKTATHIVDSNDLRDVLQHIP